MNYLIAEDLHQINEMSIEQHGGNFNPPHNLLHPEGISYVVDSVKMTVFGEEAYPEVHQKASVYMFSIINNHLFSDGNKRTGLEASLLFLRINGYKLKTQLLNEKLAINSSFNRQRQLEEITILVASGLLDLNRLQKWFKANIEPRNGNSPGYTSYAMPA
ncbi:hypothetical protein CEQ90_17730 [Lewinellaceae bacterium SD302]|nr:hypothetical protein CEQ90_17730 [Lewinellaceae bacterium SD302]